MCSLDCSVFPILLWCLAYGIKYTLQLRFEFMNGSLKAKLGEAVERHAADFGMTDPFFESFTKQYGEHIS